MCWFCFGFPFFSTTSIAATSPLGALAEGGTRALRITECCSPPFLDVCVFADPRGMARGQTGSEMGLGGRIFHLVGGDGGHRSVISSVEFRLRLVVLPEVGSNNARSPTEFSLDSDDGHVAHGVHTQLTLQKSSVYRSLLLLAT